MDKLRGFVECTIPISQCNLRCSYCYVIQEKRRNTKTNAFRCSPEQIGKAFTPDRWGGLLMVNLCAYGETLMCMELPEIVYYILKQGHYINITNNGTISKQLDKILQKVKGMQGRLCFAFSLHYVELQNKHLLQTFVNNVHKVRDAGCSYLIQLNLADEYIEHIEEIQQLCQAEFGAFPQIALTRKEGTEYSIYTSLSDDQYFDYGKCFKSPLFAFTCKNFNVKRREFCYAGKWTFKLDLASGDLRSCYFSKPYFNIYDNIQERIKTMTVGNNCCSPYCINSSHFMSLGVIPEIECPSYVDLRDRHKQWYTAEMRAFLSQKLYENNRQYKHPTRILVNSWFKYKSNRWTVKRIVSGVKRRLLKSQTRM